MAKAIKKRGKDLLKFEDAKGLKVTKPFKTSKGDIINIVRLNDNRAIIQSKSDELTIQITGTIQDIFDAPVAKGFFSDLYDRVKKAVNSIVDGVLGGGGTSGSSGGCSQSTGNVEVHITVSGGSGNVTLQPGSVNVNVQCTGPQGGPS